MSVRTNGQGWRGMSATLMHALQQVGSAKVLARLAEVSPKTAQRWQSGETQPDAGTMLLLMRRSRHVADAVLRAVGLNDLLMDVEEARLVADLARLRARRTRREANRCCD